MARGDITYAAGPIPDGTVVDVVPAGGIKQQIVAVLASGNANDGGPAASFYVRIFNGTQNVYLSDNTYASVGAGSVSVRQTMAHRGGIIINSANYLRLFNQTGSASFAYYVVLMEV